MQFVPSAHAGSVSSSPPKSQEPWPGAAPCPATTESCPSKMCGRASRHARVKSGYLCLWLEMDQAGQAVSKQGEQPLGGTGGEGQQEGAIDKLG